MKHLFIFGFVCILFACDSTDPAPDGEAIRTIKDSAFAYSFQVKERFRLQKDTHTIGNLGYTISPDSANSIAAVLLGAYRHSTFDSAFIIDTLFNLFKVIDTAGARETVNLPNLGACPHFTGTQRFNHNGQTYEGFHSQYYAFKNGIVYTVSLISKPREWDKYRKDLEFILYGIKPD